MRLLSPVICAGLLRQLSAVGLFAQDNPHEKFSAARAAVQAFQQAREEADLLKAANDPRAADAFARARQLADKADAALAQSHAAQIAAIKSGQIGSETARLLNIYQADLQRDFRQANVALQLENPPPSPPPSPSAAPAPAKQPANPFGPSGDEDRLRQKLRELFEAMTVETRGHHGDTESRYGYTAAPKRRWARN